MEGFTIENFVYFSCGIAWSVYKSLACQWQEKNLTIFIQIWLCVRFDDIVYATKNQRENYYIIYIQCLWLFW
jgi:hypothetical protein